MRRIYIFIYAKKGKIKALNIEDAKPIHEKLINDGWLHTQTLDACLFLQYIHNDCKDIINEVKGLSTIKFNYPNTSITFLYLASLSAKPM